jgi:hypothetical protein
MTHWHPGDHCIYIYKAEGGWADGQTVRLMGQVVELHKSKATIKVQNAGQDALKCVSLRKLLRIEPCPNCRRTSDIYKLKGGVYMCAECGQTIRR